MEEAKRKPGRPYSGGETARRSIRISADEWELIRQAAAAQGLTASEWIRKLALRAARRIAP